MCVSLKTAAITAGVVALGGSVMVATPGRTDPVKPLVIACTLTAYTLAFIVVLAIRYMHAPAREVRHLTHHKAHDRLQEPVRPDEGMAGPPSEDLMKVIRARGTGRG